MCPARLTMPGLQKMAKRYEQEQGETAGKIKALRLELKKADGKKMDMDFFLETIRRYTDATTITRRMVGELIDHIDVFETEEIGKNRTQRIVIYYRFVGYVEIPAVPRHPHYKADTRQGVAVEYPTEPKTA